LGRASPNVLASQYFFTSLCAVCLLFLGVAFCHFLKGSASLATSVFHLSTWNEMALPSGSRPGLSFNTSAMLLVRRVGSVGVLFHQKCFLGLLPNAAASVFHSPAISCTEPNGLMVYFSTCGWALAPNWSLVGPRKAPPLCGCSSATCPIA
jgi:hypothetical protein